MSNKKTTDDSGKRQQQKGSAPKGDLQKAACGELHLVAGGEHPALTTNQGVALSDNQNSLRANSRGPTLLEDFILREKITSFDHERIPERIVHARATGVHGFFELTASLKKYTTAKILTEVGEKTPQFTRISTVAGGAGSVDTPRDVRGFAVKFYTKEGNWDLVGNNVPVFFIQDAIKFPDLIHAVKMEPDRGFPQSATAHDTFWDFISLTPESMHMVMWMRIKKAATDAGAAVKIVAPKVGGAKLADGSMLAADGQLAGTPSVLFDAVAVILSDEGAKALSVESAAIDFVRDAFGHLKAIAVDKGGRALLKTANVGQDAGVVDANDKDAFISAAKARQWDREKSVRTLA